MIKTVFFLRNFCVVYLIGWYYLVFRVAVFVFLWLGVTVIVSFEIGGKGIIRVFLCGGVYRRFFFVIENRGSFNNVLYKVDNVLGILSILVY